MCQYKTIAYGKNVVCFNENIENHKCNRLVLKRTKSNYIFILAQKDELTASNRNLYIIPSTLGKSGYDNCSFKKNCDGSGSVIISYILLRKDNSESTNDWSNSSICDLKRCKTNICKGNGTHFGSSGYYASFGNRANYNTINDSSITTYVNKKSKNIIRQKDINEMTSKFENMCSDELSIASTAFGKRISRIDMLLCPSLNVAYMKKQKNGNDILKAVVSSDTLMWQSQICVNASTAMFHNENDCTYTVITVPKKILLTKKKQRNVPCFLLHLNECNIVSIPMVNQLSFFFQWFIFDASPIFSKNGFGKRSMFC